MIIKTIKVILTTVILLFFVHFIVSYVVPRLEEEKETGFVKKVYDGDTYQIEFNGRVEKVRALGIDTPERYESDKLYMDGERSGQDIKIIMRLGEISTLYADSLLKGKEVILEKDKIGDDRDSHRRLLRFIYLEDGTFVNMKIVEDGYATAYRKFPNSKTDEFINAENSARLNKKGLWGIPEGESFMMNQAK